MTTTPPVQQIMVDQGPLNQMILTELQTLRGEQRNGFDGLRSEFNLRMDKLVTNEAFTTEQRRVDGKFADHAQDIAAAAAKADRLSATIKWVIASVVIPFAVVAISLVARSGS